VLPETAGEVGGASYVEFGVFALQHVDSVAFWDIGEESGLQELVE